MRRALNAALAIAVALLIAWGGYQLGWWRFHYPSNPIRGIDVSHHQGSIDWRRVASSGISFAYIKATEGGDFRDSQFDRNWRDAGDAGIKRGAYHFFSLCRTGETQFNNFVTAVQNDPAALPPVIDLELGGNCETRPAAPAICDDIKRMSLLIEQKYGKRVLYYVTREFLERYGACLPKRPLWGRSLWRNPDPSWTMWQFADRARVPGIDSAVDLDVFLGDAEKWQALGKN